MQCLARLLFTRDGPSEGLCEQRVAGSVCDPNPCRGTHGASSLPHRIGTEGCMGHALYTSHFSAPRVVELFTAHLA